jgi:hypothetical protein
MARPSCRNVIPGTDDPVEAAHWSYSESWEQGAHPTRLVAGKILIKNSII